MSDSERERLKELLLEHRGKQNGIFSSEIAEELDMSDGEARPKTRKKILNLMRREKLPIAATPYHGYFVPETAEECEEYLDSQRRRAEKNRYRADLFKEALEETDYVDYREDGEKGG